jgi:hypothetical protein
VHGMSRQDVIVIGAGFCGLAAAYELSKRGFRVAVLERDAEVGGLAGSFIVNGTRLEKFYHHWFTNDAHVMGLIGDLGKADQIVVRPTRTGMYFANTFFRLSTPFDLLRFTPLSFPDRIRLGLLALRARRVGDWRRLEDLTASEWLRTIGGDRVYRVVWEPLLRGKFGDVADEISAVWFWNKLKLRGGSRGKGGGEQLAYYRGGFAALAEAMVEAIRVRGGEVVANAPAIGVRGRRRTGDRHHHEGRRSRRERRDRDPAAAGRRRPGAAARFAPLRRTVAAHSLSGQCVHCPRARPQPLDHVLAERERSGVSLCRRHRTYEFRAELDLWRTAHHLSL